MTANRQTLKNVSYVVTHLLTERLIETHAPARLARGQ
jgi:hypothetical protein